MKSEPNVFSIDNLAAAKNQTSFWDCVRKYQARNMLRDDFQVGDHAFFYHSSCAEPGIAGIVKIVKAAYSDPTQFDPHSEYYDPKSTYDALRWFGVDVKLVKKFKTPISLTHIKTLPELADMRLVQRGNRLSITPVTAMEWDTIIHL